MDKRIDFYQINFRWDLATYSKDISQISAECYSLLEKKVILEKQYQIAQSENKEVVMEILEKSNNALFGVMSKIENLKDGILKQIIAEDKTKKVSVNNYTYFYMDFNELKIATIYNANVPKLTTHFLTYMKGILSETNYLIEIYSLIDEDNFELNRVSQIKKIIMKFGGGSIAAKKILSFDDTLSLSNENILEATVSLALKLEPVSHKTRSFFKNRKNLAENFKKLEVHTISDDDEYNELDLLEGHLRRKVTIDIDEEVLKTREDVIKIKEALRTSIKSILTTN